MAELVPAEGTSPLSRPSPASPVTLETIRNLERLAYLRLSTEDRQALVGDLAKILDYARSLTELDLAEYAPLTHAMEQTNVMRSDETEPSSSLEQALSNAPQAVSPYIQVPQVLE